MANQIITGGVGSSASAFLDMLGVNAHVGTGAGGYQNSSLIIGSLNYLGVKTIRTNFTTTTSAGAIIEALANADVEFNFVTNSSLPATGSAGLTKYITSLGEFAKANPDAVYAVEGLNEVNIQGFSWNGQSNMTAAGAFQKVLYEQVKSNTALKNVSVINLSVAYESLADYKAIGDLSSYADFANSHAYTPTHTGADAVMEVSMANAASIAKGKRTVITETGYTTHSSTDYLGVSELAQAKLTLSGLLNAFENGSSKTFLYELFNSDLAGNTKEKERHFGLFNDDGTPKQAANAIHNLTTILSASDGGTGNIKPPSYTFGGMPADGHANLLTKDGGVYDIMVWRDVLSWDNKNRTDASIAATPVTINFGTAQQNVYVYNPLLGKQPVAVYHNVSTISLPLGDSPLIVEVGAKGAVTEPVRTADPDLSMTAAALVAGIDGLHGAEGLKTITLTGDPVLRVSTIETMRYMVDNYADVLSTIKGGYGFLVTTNGEGWRLEKSYDKVGSLIATTDYAMANGVPLNKHEVGVDGHEYTARYNNGVIAQSVELAVDKTRTITSFDAVGKMTTRQTQRASETRTETYKAGVLSSLVVDKADGSKLTDTFDASGRRLTEVTVDPAKTWTTQVFDPTSGTLKNRYVKWADGSAENGTYGVSGQSYVTQVQKVDANGKVSSLTRFHADGTLDYAESYGVDGSRSTATYDTTGRKLTDVLIQANGARTTNVWDAPTGRLVRSTATDPVGTTVKTYTAGILTNLTVNRADGSSMVSTFDTQGRKLTEATVDTQKLTTTSRYDVGTGAVAQTYVQRPDGSAENTTYGIVGQSYVTQVQSVDAKGKLIGIVRSHADGTLDYTETTSVEGTRTMSYHDVRGRQTSEVILTSAGDRTTSTFDVATNKLAKQVVALVNGETTTRTYADGALSNRVTLQKDGSRSVETVVNGGRTVDSFDAKGARLSSVTVDVAQTWTTLTYDKAGGKLSRRYVTRADGTHENTAYNITGQAYAIETQMVDKAGKVVGITRARADGSLLLKDVTAADGSRTTVSFDGAGRQTSSVAVAINGVRVTSTFNVVTGKLVQQVTDRSAVASNRNSNDSASVPLAAAVAEPVKTVDTFNADGALTSRADIAIDGTWTTSVLDVGTGSVTRKYVTLPDGGHENTTYGIQGQAYASMVQSVSAAGKLTMVTRVRADNSTYSTEAYPADGSQRVAYFDTADRTVSQIVTDKAGTKTTLNYDPTTSTLVRTVVAEKGGAITTSNYTGGVLASVTTATVDGGISTRTLAQAGHDLVQPKAALGTYNAILIADGTRKLAGSFADEILLADAPGMTLTGGEGADRFRIALGTGRTTITDFGVGADILDVSLFTGKSYKPTIALEGANTVMSFGNGDQVTLVGIEPNRLHGTGQANGMFAFG